MLVTFEGGDGAGKTTLMDRLFAVLIDAGRKVRRTRAPGGTPLGESIRQLLLQPSHLVPMSLRCELFLFLADRAQHVDEVILPALAEGDIVLCDRFNDSTMAYQSGARGFDTSWISELCTFASAGVVPGLTFYLDIDPIVGLSRAKGQRHSEDRIESEAISFHQRIREAFLSIAAQEPNRFIVLDAHRPAEEVFLAAMEKINARLLPLQP